MAPRRLSSVGSTSPPAPPLPSSKSKLSQPLLAHPNNHANHRPRPLAMGHGRFVVHSSPSPVPPAPPDHLSPLSAAATTVVDEDVLSTRSRAGAGASLVATRRAPAPAHPPAELAFQEHHTSELVGNNRRR
ncbi:hypothetical protein ABZP36_004869 [Zizania latifolia]